MSGRSLQRSGMLIVVGTRPEAIKLAPLIIALRERAVLDVTVCATGQHRELLDGALADFGLIADIDLGLMQPGQRPEAVVAAALPALTAVIASTGPAAVIVQGDTASACAGAQAGAYAQLPVVHVKAGVRSGSTEPFPEELHRRVIGQLATLHFAPTAAARAALRGEGVADAAIKLSGNTGIDALRLTAARLAADPELHRLAAAQLPATNPALPLLLVTVHRRENRGARLLAVAAALHRLAATGGVEIVIPVHPHPTVRDTLTNHLGGIPGIHLIPPLSYLAFVVLLQRARLALTDSGGVQEEAPALGCPVLVLRGTTERREGIAAGGAQLVGTNADTIVAAVGCLLDDAGHHAAMATPRFPYGDGYPAGRIASILEFRFASAALGTEIAQAL